MLEEERTALCGPRYQHDLQRQALIETMIWSFGLGLPCPAVTKPAQHGHLNAAGDFSLFKSESLRGLFRNWLLGLDAIKEFAVWI